MLTQKYHLINTDYYLRYAKDYYNKYKEEIKEEARTRYSSLSPEETQKNIDYSKNYYLNLPKDKKKEIIEKIRLNTIVWMMKKCKSIKNIKKMIKNYGAKKETRARK